MASQLDTFFKYIQMCMILRPTWLPRSQYDSSSPVCRLVVEKVLELIDQSREVLMKEPNVLQVQVGDTWLSTQGAGKGGLRTTNKLSYFNPT